MPGAPATVTAALRQAAERLAPVSHSPRLDAEWLMAHALGTGRSEMLLRHGPDEPPADFAALIARRGRGEPVAHIVGHTEFYGLTLTVTPDVLIPRSDSEVLIDAARERLAERSPARVLDCGTGSGALLLAALSLWPEARGIGIERSAAALAIAKTNATACGLAERATMRAGDWTGPDWRDGLGRFDLVLANPPYVETDDRDLAPEVRAHEPAEALFAGADGLDDYRILIPQLPHVLAPDGIALFEIGARQSDAVTAIAHGAGLASRLHHDLAGRPRALEMWMMGQSTG